jgi:hypothetical protein
MDLRPQPLSGRHIESVPVGSAEVRLLGSVASARGVQVIAFDDVANYRGDFTSTLMSLSYLSRIPANRMLSVDRRPARPVRPLNFVVPGVPVATHGGPVRGVFCIFSPGFFKDLSETDVSLRFDAIDFLIDIAFGRRGARQIGAVADASPGILCSRSSVGPVEPERAGTVARHQRTASVAHGEGSKRNERSPLDCRMSRGGGASLARRDGVAGP